MNIKGQRVKGKVWGEEGGKDPRERDYLPLLHVHGNNSLILVCLSRLPICHCCEQIMYYNTTPDNRYTVFP